VSRPQARITEIEETHAFQKALPARKAAHVLLDTCLLDDARAFTTDICIIGAGAAGIALALRLRNSNLRVCVVESGGLSLEEDTQALYAGASIGHPMELDVGRYRVFGGSTSLWTARCAPLDRWDFMKRDWIPDSGWPITIDDVAPFYEDAKRVCGFHDGWTSMRVPPSLRPVGSYLDPFRWEYPGRSKHGLFNFGQMYRDELQRSATTLVLTHANVVGFEATGDVAQVRKVVARSISGRQITVAAKAFVLCCGGIENARILLNTASTIPGGLGNRHDIVGRYFMQHPRGNTASVAVSRTQAQNLQRRFKLHHARRNARVEHGFALPFAAQRDHQILNASAVLTYGGRLTSGWEALKRFTSRGRGRQQTNLLADLWYCARDAREISRNLILRRSRGLTPTFGEPLVDVMVDVEQVPDRESRVMLSPTIDQLGNPEVTINWKISEMERKTARILTTLIATEFDVSGLGEVSPRPWLSSDAPLSEREFVQTHHHIGTTRMSSDPRNGVVDANSMVHGTANLFVAGCSVFPTGGHANPTLTIVALALRLGDHLKTKLGTGPL
jgi:choline dehydrogenase-like flavoprotein